jgi:hypothetical protein
MTLENLRQGLTPIMRVNPVSIFLLLDHRVVPTPLSEIDELLDSRTKTSLLPVAEHFIPTSPKSNGAIMGAEALIFPTNTAALVPPDVVSCRLIRAAPVPT